MDFTGSRNLDEYKKLCIDGKSDCKYDLEKLVKIVDQKTFESFWNRRPDVKVTSK